MSGQAAIEADSKAWIKTQGTQHHQYEWVSAMQNCPSHPTTTYACTWSYRDRVWDPFGGVWGAWVNRNAQWSVGPYQGTAQAVCPANTTKQADGSCLCNQGYRTDTKTPAGATCVPYTCQPKNLGQASYGPYLSSMLEDRYYCDTEGPNMGCTRKFTADASFADTGSGQYWSHGTESYTGGNCQGSGTGQGPGSPADNPTKPPDPDKPTDQNPCTGTKVPGTINGQTMCYEPVKSEQKGGTQETKDGSGATTGSTQTKTECDGASCTTTTTTKDASGQQTGQTVVTESQSAFCMKNPTATVCGGSGSGGSGSGNGTGNGGGGTCTGDDCDDGDDSSFGGTCEASFTCQGDAIQCAIAKEQHMRNCTLFAKVDTLSVDGEAAIEGGDTPPDHPNNPANIESQGLNMAQMIDTSSGGLGGACFLPDQSVSMGPFGEVNLALSKACEPLGTAGKLAVAFAWLAAAFIMFKGVR